MAYPIRWSTYVTVVDLYCRMKNLLHDALTQAGMMDLLESPVSRSLSHSITIGNDDDITNSSSIHDHLDADVVYGTGSLVPSHSNVKVLLDVLGEHVNIAEFGLDWQGEHLPEIITALSWSNFNIMHIFYKVK